LLTLEAADLGDNPNHVQDMVEGYTHLFKGLGNLDDLELALKYNQALVDVTPTGHPDLAVTFHHPEYVFSIFDLFRLMLIHL